jgi:hypothetical protein
VKKETTDNIAGTVCPIALLAMLSTPAIWAYQMIFHWLRWGEWLPISVAVGLHWLGFGTPQFVWTGVQKVSDFVMTWPLSITLFFGILGLLTLFNEWAERQDKAGHSTVGE